MKLCTCAAFNEAWNLNESAFFAGCGDYSNDILKNIESIWLKLFIFHMANIFFLQIKWDLYFSTSRMKLRQT